MRLSFGTDGVRGLANLELTPEYVTALGRAAATVLTGTSWVIGRDTRRSGSLLSAALATGLAAEGADVRDLGVLPTPAVAYFSEVHGCPAAVISASHNPFGDNGVKFFAEGGLKLDDITQTRIEIQLTAFLDGPLVAHEVPIGGAVGTIEASDGGLVAYGDHIVGDVLDGRVLGGINVVIDTANGAASVIAPSVLQRLGASVTVLHANPNGVNINDQCGSTYPEDLSESVRARGANVGLAFDGDADRLVAVDEHGTVVDGDDLLGIFAIDRHERGLLPDATIVATVMSNLGLDRSLADKGISVVRCGVGDRNVLASLEDGHWTLGGEQSGHIIFRDLATTGDGLLAAVQLLDVLARSGRPLSELTEVIVPLPQVLRNVRLAAPVPGLVDQLSDDVASAETKLDGDGRVLVRLSGTEPLVRVMVEATTDSMAIEVVDDLVAAVHRITQPS